MQEHQISHVFRNFEDMVSCSRAFGRSKNAEEGRKLIENYTYPKSISAVKKYSLKTLFWDGRMVGKQKSSAQSLEFNAWMLSYSQYYR